MGYRGGRYSTPSTGINVGKNIFSALIVAVGIGWVTSIVGEAGSVVVDVSGTGVAVEGIGSRVKVVSGGIIFIGI